MFGTIRKGKRKMRVIVAAAGTAGHINPGLAIANKIKQEEKRIVALSTIGKKYNGKYPVEITFKPHFKDHRQDLDNFRYKGIIDGLVACNVLKNDNLNHIQKITLEPVFDNKEIIEIEIKEI